jgi:hypothetical protein
VSPHNQLLTRCLTARVLTAGVMAAGLVSPEPGQQSVPRPGPCPRRDRQPSWPE